MKNKSIKHSLYFIVPILLASCNSSEEQAKDLTVLEDTIEIVEPWVLLNVDSMINVHKDSMLFMNYWSGMSPDEFKAVTEQNFQDGAVRKGSNIRPARGLPTGQFQSDLLVQYNIYDTVTIEMNMFYLAPIQYERDHVDRMNYRAEKDLRESPNGAIVLFDSQRNYKYTDSLIKLKFKDKKTFSAEIAQFYTKYFLDDSVYVGSTMYSLDKTVPEIFPTIILRSLSDGEYLKVNANHPPGGYKYPDFDYGNFFGNE